MVREKDIRITSKRVDDEWKLQIERDRGVSGESTQVSVPAAPLTSSQCVSSPVFLQLINSLAYQAMMQIEEAERQASEEVPGNVEGVREIIEILEVLRMKTARNLSAEESVLLERAEQELKKRMARFS